MVKRALVLAFAFIALPLLASVAAGPDPAFLSPTLADDIGLYPVNQTFLNPAGVGLGKFLQVVITSTPKPFDVKLWSAAVLVPSSTPTPISIAVGVEDESTGGLFHVSDAAGRSFSSGSFVPKRQRGMIAAGYAFSPMVSLGARAVFNVMTLATATAQRWSGDVGVMANVAGFYTSFTVNDVVSERLNWSTGHSETIVYRSILEIQLPLGRSWVGIRTDFDEIRGSVALSLHPTLVVAAALSKTQFQTGVILSLGPLDLVAHRTEYSNGDLGGVAIVSIGLVGWF